MVAESSETGSQNIATAFEQLKTYYNAVRQKVQGLLENITQADSHELTTSITLLGKCQSNIINIALCCQIQLAQPWSDDQQLEKKKIVEIAELTGVLLGEIEAGLEALNSGQKAAMLAINLPEDDEVAVIMGFNPECDSPVRADGREHLGSIPPKNKLTL